LIYSILADLTVALHLVYAAYVLFGYFFVLAGIIFKWRWIRNFTFRISHLICTLLVGLEAAGGVICPLTILENRLLRASGGAGYERSFFGHLFSELLYYQAPEWVFTVSYITWSLLVLLTFVLAPPRRRVHSQ